MKVFFDSRMSTPSGGYSPSADKPAAVVSDWLESLPITCERFVPATRDHLLLAHDAGYVDAVLSGRTVNGHGNRDLRIAQSCLWTCGSLMAAAKAALSARITCSPSSGFHHAGPSSGGGFCTFNGLVVTARHLLRTREVSGVLILDWDAHYGDGTDKCLRDRDDGGAIRHWTFGAELSSVDGQFLHGGLSVERVYESAAQAIRRAAADGFGIVLYQAGADPHMDDPLGGHMTAQQMQRRDRMVFRTAVEVGIPVAWNLAGGYQREPDGSIPKVLALHRNTMVEALNTLAGAAVDQAVGRA
jgi:acetoin utilization deacetylase AcuC-like enzyme